jgi:2-beta-glucuronyltransferase
MGFGGRKNSVVFLTEGLAELGWKVDLVTAQLSFLSQLAGVPRLKAVPHHERNVWLEQTNLISNFVWVPPFHPATTRYALMDRVATPIFQLYPYLLPETIRQRIRHARLIVIESCSAVLLFPLLKRLAPAAKFVYRACDSLDAIGMHPILSKAEKQTARDYDLFTSPSKLILANFPPDVNTCHVPQGLQKALFDTPMPSPFEGQGPHVIVAGDMMFDRQSFEIMVRNFPKITFHAFGRMDLAGLTSCDNLICYGEVPFETLRSYILHADCGIAPYLDQPEVHYLAESSLKIVQYTYAQIPILAPYFCKGNLEHLKAYQPGDKASIIRALEQALMVDRRAIDRSGVQDWKEVITGMLSQVGLDPEG